MNAAFKHLEDRTRIGELTLAQWGWLTVGVVLALSWGFYLSPFGAMATIFSAIYVAGLPALAALFAGFTEFDLLDVGRGAWSWWRGGGRFMPGAGGEPHGYVIHAEPAAGIRGGAPPPLELGELWEL